WQEMQNRVCSERWMCVFIPPTTHIAGSKNKPMNARSFQPTACVNEGRIKKTEASTMLRTIWQINTAITTPPFAVSITEGESFPPRVLRRLFLFCQLAKVPDQPFDLVVRDLALIRRHFLAFAVRDAVGQLCVRLLLHIAGRQIRDA